MIKRVYIHNFRCFQNFEFKSGDRQSLLIIGKNGSGKSSFGSVLKRFQQIGRGISGTDELFTISDFANFKTDVPMRFEIEVEIEKNLYRYILALELPVNFQKLRILEESLSVDGNAIFKRDKAEVKLLSNHRTSEFLIDWHVIALGLVQEQSETGHLDRFRTWLARMIILAPEPKYIDGTSVKETLEPNKNGSNLGAWFSAMIVRFPSSYSVMESYLKQIMPDIQDIQNKPTGEDSKLMMISYKSETGAILRLPLSALSDGEKCFFIVSVVLAANKAYGPIFCFWDEPDNFLSLSEVGHFVMELRRSFDQQGQFMATSHNPEAIQKFSKDDIALFYRNSHLEPTLTRYLEEMSIQGSVVEKLIIGDLTDGGK